MYDDLGDITTPKSLLTEGVNRFVRDSNKTAELLFSKLLKILRPLIIRDKKAEWAWHIWMLVVSEKKRNCEVPIIY